MPKETRIEHQYHEVIWGVANASNRIERAVSDGRALAYMVLENAEPDSSHAIFATRWLDEFGRDPLRERKRETPDA